MMNLFEKRETYLILGVLIGLGIGLYYGYVWGTSETLQQCLNISKSLNEYCVNAQVSTPLYNFSGGLL